MAMHTHTHTLAAAAIGAAALCAVTEAAIRYVDRNTPVSCASGQQDGEDWPTAYRYLQDALAVAAAADLIRVADGTYYPDESCAAPAGTGDPNATFDVSDIQILGGYAGYGAADPDARGFLTTLSGDIDGDRVLDSDNSYNVVSFLFDDDAAESLLDGCTVEMGNNPGFGDGGGGILFIGVRGTVRGCRVVNNRAQVGGGGIELLDVGGRVRIERCLIENNVCDPGHGGGLSFKISGVAEIVKCKFLNNESVSEGGGMYASAGQIKVVNCVFIANRAETGAASEGGGLHRSDPDAADPITNCLFASNAADAGGDAVFVANYSAAESITFTNCTLAHNPAQGGGEAMATVGLAAGSVVVRNGIFWDNAGAAIAPQDADDVTVSFSDVQGGWPGAGNIEADPSFLDPDGADGTLGTIDDNYRLQETSAAIDVGDDGSLPADEFDVDGDMDTQEPTPDLDLRPRVLDGGVYGVEVDMGAYEFPANCPWDCASQPDQFVGIPDLLVLLGQWGSSGSCEFDDPDATVGINDLLDLLSHWGPCLAASQGQPQSVEDCIERYGYEDPVVLESCICAVEPQECPE
jgi:hypothetical protein